MVRRPDRKELLAFLKGTDSLIPKSIDKSARLEMPTHVKRSAEDKLEGTAAKKARLDGGQVMKKLFFLISCFKISQDMDQNDFLSLIDTKEFDHPSRSLLDIHLGFH